MLLLQIVITVAFLPVLCAAFGGAMDDTDSPLSRVTGACISLVVCLLLLAVWSPLT